VEKPGPEHVDVDTISAGAYVIEREVLGMLTRGEPASIERDVFPALVGAGLRARVHEDAYWLDIGTPQRYLEGSFDILEGAVATPVADRVADGGVYVAPDADAAGRVVGPALVEPGCRIAATARVGGRAILQRGVTVGEHSVVERSVVLAGTEIGPNCVVRGCIVGRDVRLGDGTHVEGLAVLGEGVRVGAGNQLAHGIRVFPGVDLPDGAVRFP
jgi:mannose-1-phosphate guanylyltransferase